MNTQRQTNDYRKAFESIFRKAFASIFSKSFRVHFPKAFRFLTFLISCHMLDDVLDDMLDHVFFSRSWRCVFSCVIAPLNLRAIRTTNRFGAHFHYFSTREMVVLLFSDRYLRSIWHRATNGLYFGTCFLIETWGGCGYRVFDWLMRYPDPSRFLQDGRVHLGL